MDFVIHLLMFFCVYVIVVQSLNIVIGHGGLLNLAQPSFFAAGCYGYALTQVKIVQDFGVGVAVGWVAAAALSAIIAWPASRSRVNGYLLITVAFHLLMIKLIITWHTPGEPMGTLANPFNGPYGIRSIPSLKLLGVTLTENWQVLALFALLAAISAGLHAKISRSPWGLTLRATRDDELAASSIGKPIRLERVKATVLGALMVSTAGAMYAAYVQSIGPSVVSLNQAVLWLSMLVVGGTGSQLGTFAGPALLLLAPEVIRFAPLPPQSAASVELLTYSVLILVVLYLRPNGLFGRSRLQ